MIGILEALDYREGGTVLLTRETTNRWPFVQRLFSKGGFFPGGLAIAAARTPRAPAGDATIAGTTTIGGVAAKVTAAFSGSGEAVELDLALSVSLAGLGGDGSALSAAWEPEVTFSSNGGSPRIGLDHAARGVVHLGEFELIASIELPGPRIMPRFGSSGDDPAGSSWLRATVPGPQVVATLRPDPKPLSTLMGPHGLGDVADSLLLQEVRLVADPWDGVYSLGIEARGHWKVMQGCELTGLAAELVYASEDGTTAGRLRASVTLGGVPLQVEAAHDPAVSGWQFEGGIVHETPCDLAAFVDALLAGLGTGGTCPDALKGATVSALSASFNTATGALGIRCEASLPLRNKQALDIVLIVCVEDGRRSFHGTVTLGSLEFDLVFDDANGDRTLVASFSDHEPSEVRLGDLIAPALDGNRAADREIIRLGNTMSFFVKDALFAYGRHGDGAAWLLAADVEAGTDFSGLPLIGASFPPGEGARLLFQPLLTSGGDHLAALADRVHGGGLRLPSPLPAAAGLSVTTRLSLGTEEIKLGLPVDMSRGSMAHAPDAAPAAAPAGATSVDEMSWIAVQRAFGPLAFERVGVRYDARLHDTGGLDIRLDAHLSAAGLTLALAGFGLTVPLSDPDDIRPRLDGLAIDFRSPDIEIGGSLARQHVGGAEDGYDEFVGSAIVKAGPLTVDAFGAYRVIDGHPSLFVYAALDYPIGGPAFFFVTGLAAAFGYNRAFKLPPIEKLADFPLLADGVGKGDVRSAGALRTASDALREYIPAEVGAVFLGVGIKFTSFQTIASSALVTASFGREVSLDLIGRSTLIMPAGATREQAVAVVDMAWLASYRPKDGLLALRAQLSPGSYVFARDCHLTGGFAFHSWFTAPHEGEFVITAGGYHPAFDLASRPHFPRVPRLGVAWRVSDALSIKGDAYYALTSSAAMAGGHLELLWEQHPYRAWCKAGIDCLFEWKPLHYTGEAYVELGASYTFEFAGTRHITIEVGADLTVWGPPFSGRARVNLVLFSFDVVFGSAAAKPPPVHLFDDDGCGNGGGFMALLPEKDRLCAVSVADGLSRVVDGRKVVNPKTLRLLVDTVIPSKRIHVEGMASEPQDRTGNAPAPFGILPMDLKHDDIECDTTVTVTKADDAAWTPKHLQYRLRTKGFPAALWGEPGKSAAPARPGDGGLIKGLAGVEIVAAGTVDTGARDTVGKVLLLERHRPALRDGIYDIGVTQRLSTPPHDGDGARPLKAEASLRFEVGGEETSLPDACIHSVFPPKGSLGAHATSLPQVVLERSTMPWERPAQVEGATEDTPWLALLVFDGEMKAVAKPAADGTPGPARITVDLAELPSARELALLCHVRAPKDGNGAQRAVVVANRAPAAARMSTAHLVSMRGIEADGTRRSLVSLLSWTFSCPADGGSFTSLMEAIVPAPIAAAATRLPHALPNGRRGEADYRGPLVPMARAGRRPAAQPPRCPDRPDISQAAALELGRLLALESKSVSVGLLRLKRALAQDARHESQARAAGHVHPRSTTAAPPASRARTLLPAGLQALLTPELAEWAGGLLMLEGMPFRYLLPDESLLPKESMRSFAVDERWMTNLLVGALGVGGAWCLGEEARAAMPGFEPAFSVGKGPVAEGQTPFGPLPRLSGIVLRSQIVSGWPALSVEADGNHRALACRRLSPNILLAVFRGNIRSVVFGLPEETLHLELSAKDSPLPAAWLAEATSSVQLGPHVKPATRPVVSFEL